jgi:ubiquinol-cytochrome c reductase cytochrome c subunit
LLLALASLGTRAEGPASAAEIERGRALFMSNGCYACHGTVGQGGERSGAPRLAPEPLPAEVLTAFLRHPREGMPRFDAQFLSDGEIAGIHAYLASIPKGPTAKEIALLRN